MKSIYSSVFRGVSLFAISMVFLLGACSADFVEGSALSNENTNGPTNINSSQTATNFNLLSYISVCKSNNIIITNYHYYNTNLLYQITNNLNCSNNQITRSDINGYKWDAFFEIIDDVPNYAWLINDYEITGNIYAYKISYDTNGNKVYTPFRGLPSPILIVFGPNNRTKGTGYTNAGSAFISPGSDIIRDGKYVTEYSFTIKVNRAPVPYGGQTYYYALGSYDIYPYEVVGLYGWGSCYVDFSDSPALISPVQEDYIVYHSGGGLHNFCWTDSFGNYTSFIKDGHTQSLGNIFITNASMIYGVTGRHTWQIVSYGYNNEEHASEEYTYYVIPQTPSLTFPSSNAICGKETTQFCWGPTEGANSYILYIIILHT